MNKPLGLVLSAAPMAARAPYPQFWRTVGRRPARRRPGVLADFDWPAGERPLRLVVVGKGGSGKSVIAGTLARTLARRGRKVLALDTDTMPGLAISLGFRSPATPPLTDAVVKAEHGCWKLKRGVGPVRAVQRYSTLAPDGVRVLEVGDHPAIDAQTVTPSVQAFYQLIHALPESKGLRDWTMIGDHPAGPRQAVHDWAPYAEMLLIVAEPTWKSALTARRLVDVARQRQATMVVVASKVRHPADVERVEEMVGATVDMSVPADEAVAACDREGVAVIDRAPDCPAVAAVEELAAGLVSGRLGGVAGR